MYLSTIIENNNLYYTYNKGYQLEMEITPSQEQMMYPMNVLKKNYDDGGNKISHYKYHFFFVFLFWCTNPLSRWNIISYRA